MLGGTLAKPIHLTFTTPVSNLEAMALTQPIRLLTRR